MINSPMLIRALAHAIALGEGLGCGLGSVFVCHAESLALFRQPASPASSLRLARISAGDALSVGIDPPKMCTAKRLAFDWIALQLWSDVT